MVFLFFQKDALRGANYCANTFGVIINALLQHTQTITYYDETSSD